MLNNKETNKNRVEFIKKSVCIEKLDGSIKFYMAPEFVKKFNDDIAEVKNLIRDIEYLLKNNIKLPTGFSFNFMISSDDLFYDLISRDIKSKTKIFPTYAFDEKIKQRKDLIFYTEKSFMACLYDGDNYASVNKIHELSHLIQAYYIRSYKSAILPVEEGFAELLPLYILDMEKIYDLHREHIKKLSFDKIKTVSNINKYGMRRENEKFRAQFNIQYNSTYLWMLGVFHRIEKKYNVDKFGAMDLFLNYLKNNNEFNEDDFAKFVGEPKRYLFNTKKLQMESQSEIAELDKQIKLSELIKKESVKTV